MMIMMMGVIDLIGFQSPQHLIPCCGGWGGGGIGYLPNGHLKYNFLSQNFVCTFCFFGFLQSTENLGLTLTHYIYHSASFSAFLQASSHTVPNNNLNLGIKTEPISGCADATVYVWLLCHTYTIAFASYVPGSVAIHYFWNSVYVKMALLHSSKFVVFNNFEFYNFCVLHFSSYIIQYQCNTTLPKNCFEKIKNKFLAQIIGTVLKTKVN